MGHDLSRCAHGRTATTHHRIIGPALHLIVSIEKMNPSRTKYGRSLHISTWTPRPLGPVAGTLYSADEEVCREHEEDDRNDLPPELSHRAGRAPCSHCRTPAGRRDSGQPRRCRCADTTGVTKERRGHREHARALPNSGPRRSTSGRCVAARFTAPMRASHWWRHTSARGANDANSTAEMAVLPDSAIRCIAMCQSQHGARRA